MKATVLFGIPQSEIASLINNKISNSHTIKIVTGFATVEGVKALKDSLGRYAKAVKLLVIGAGTYKAYEAMDQLIQLGVENNNIFVHLGHTKLTKPDATHRFYRYHPMLHSKIYYFEDNRGAACAIVGSHNMTGFALKGLNGEASIMLEGKMEELEFEKIRSHLDSARHEAIIYNSGMKEAFAWWAHEFFDGLAQKANDIPRDLEKTKTIILFCQSKDGYPVKDNILYFELPEAIGKIQSMRAEVHVFVFDRLPDTPGQCLANLSNARYSYWCKMEGVENDKGGKELSADWYIGGKFNQILLKARAPFRPSPQPKMQQIRVRVNSKVYDKFDYLFGSQAKKWLPLLDPEQQVSYDAEFAFEVDELNLIPAETVSWGLVKGLKAADNEYEPKSAYYITLKSLEPDSGSYILFSTGRRKVGGNKR